MKIDLTDRQAMAARKLCQPLLRTLNAKDLAEVEVHKIEWRDLVSLNKTTLKTARDLLEKAEAESREEKLADFEAAHEALMELVDAVTFELDARNEIGDRSPRAQGGSPKRPGGGLVVMNGAASDADEVDYALRPEQRLADWQAEHRGPSDFAGLGLGQYLRAMVTGAKSDLEKRALSEGSDSAGGYTVPDILSSRLIDLMRARQIVIRAGAQTMPLTSDQHYIATVATDPTVAWRSENAAVNESDPTFSRISLVPRSLAVLTKVSRELFEDSLNLETELPRIIARAMAVEVDRVALHGSGTAPEPTGIENTSGVNSVAHNAALTAYSPFITARRKILQANHAPDFISYIIDPVMDGDLANLTASDNQPLMMPKVLDTGRWFVTTNIEGDASVSPEDGTAIVGDFRRLVIGVRNDVRIDILRERYADNYQYGILAAMRVDVAVTHADAFTKVTGIVASG